MSRISDSEIDGLLKQGLRETPVPEASADFDSRVHAGLRRREPVWESLWGSLRPMLAPAGLSLAVTLAALIVLGAPRPDSPARLQRPLPSSIALGRSPERFRSVDQAIERLDHETPSLGGFAHPRREPPASRPPEPKLPGRRGASTRPEADAYLNT